MTGQDLDLEHAAAAAVAGVGASPAVVRRLLVGMPAVAAWEALATGRHPADPAGRYRRRARLFCPARAAAACSAAGVAVVCATDPTYPRRLTKDPNAPAVLFAVGTLAAADAAPQVAVVGTRAATWSGEAVAGTLGCQLAMAGVAVVSGLAPGIDQAAHRGTLAVPGAVPIAVVGSAADLPAGRPGMLADAVAAHGVVLSEVAPGSPSARWRFAVRNRLMAALADLVVVVESHSSGGSLHTVAAAQRLGVPVAAVPGPVGASASAGTNALLATRQAIAVRDAADVLHLIGHGDRPGHAAPPIDAITVPARPPRLPADLAGVHDVLAITPVPIDQVADACGRTLGDVAWCLHRLAALGLADEEHGWWRRC